MPRTGFSFTEIAISLPDFLEAIFDSSVEGSAILRIVSILKSPISFIENIDGFENNSEISIF